MGPVRSALYLDFDNVFSGLLKLDPAVALSFAEKPGEWLGRLAAEEGHARRWLVLRCYLNPAGSVPDPRGDGTRVNFFRFRSAFTDAGFEVIDCPRLSHTKNGADIRLAIDAVESLRADARYDEFVIASGDSDMTPLLVRLRADDRQVTLVSPSDSAVVMQAVADRLIDGEELIDLIDTRADVIEASVMGLGDFQPASHRSRDLSEDEAKERFAELVTERYRASTEPINLASLAHEAHRELGPIAKESKWFGRGGFVRALQALDLPHLRMAATYMWDHTRHVAPDAIDAEEPTPVPDVVGRLSGVLKIPTLTPDSWSGTYTSLATFVRTYDFNLTEMTRWTRDRLAESGTRTNRHAVSLVAHGAAFGGCPLYRQPPPDDSEIAQAFVRNLLDRAVAADVYLSDAEAETVRQWFCAPSLDLTST